MFCTNCGTQLADGVKFCFNCGTSVVNANTPAIIPRSQIPVDDASDSNQINAPVPVQTVHPYEETDIEKTEVYYEADSQYEDSYTEEPEVFYGDVTEYEESYQEAENIPEYIKPKKSKAKIIIPIAGGVAIAGIAIFAGAKLIGSLGSGSHPVAFVSGKDFMMTSKVKGKNTKTLDISKTKYEDQYSNTNYNNSLMQFSKDGKYLFFLTKYDTNDSTGTLNRAECSKLKEDSSKNEKYIDTIDSDVSRFSVISGKEAVYRTADGDLYFYDGKEKQKIHKDVQSFWCDEKGNIVYILHDADNDENTLYAVTTKDISADKKLLSDISDSYILDYDDLSTVIACKKNEDDTTISVYKCGYSMDDAEKIASDVELCNVNNKKLYFTQITGSKTSYDLVEDDYADKDEGLTEPDSKDYQIPYYDYTKISNTNQSYSEMYTSVTNDCNWFDKGWYYSSMADSVDNSSYSDGVRAAVQNFIDKYEDKQDNQGFLLVTSEVMKDLQAINNADSSKKTNDWVKLCFTREEDGTTTDYDAYNAAYDKYYEASGRINARETLQAKENDRPVYSLMEYSDGKVTTIQENIAGVRFGSDIVYNTYDMLTEKVAIQEYQGLSQIKDLTSVNLRTQPVFVLNTKDDRIIQFGEDTCESISDISESEGFVLSTSDYIYYQIGEEIYEAPISKDVVGTFENEISDDTAGMRVINDKLYYANEPYTSHDNHYGDLHCITKGEDETLASDIAIDVVRVYDDGLLMYSIDGSLEDTYKGFTLAVKPAKGEETELGDDVTEFIRVDDHHIYYISGNDLYDYNGKKSERAISDVDHFWTTNSVSYKLISLY